MVADAADGQAERRAADFARSLAAGCERLLGPRLIGIYLLGSLAHGGFSRRYSDIDLGILAEQGLAAAEQQAVRAEAGALAPHLATKLSIFWSDRAFAVGRFPPLDRIDYLDHAVALVERERVAPTRPTIAEVRAYLAGAPFAAWAERARGFAGAERLAPEERKPYLRALLYPARLIYSWETGCMGSNDAAVAHLESQPPAGLDVALIGRALACRQAAADPDPLFCERAALTRQLAACERLLQR